MRNTEVFRKVDGYTRSLEAKKAGLYPYFRPILSGQDSEVMLSGNRKALMLGSNNYLGLCNHPDVTSAAIDAVRKYGTGCSGSRFLNGTLGIHLELEEALAEWVGKDSALLFSTGFQTNQGVLTALLGRHDHIFMDAHNHASIIDGARLSAATSSKYAHNDMAALEEGLRNAPEGKGRFIVSDGVFSMEGDVVDLPALVNLAEQYEAAVMIDDAHGLGVLGPGGNGTCAHFGLTDRVDLIMGTFSKSLASVGGFVAADTRTIEFLKHHSRALIFSASLPPPCVASVLAALRVLEREPERITRLLELSKKMRDGLQSLGFDTGTSTTPIIPVLVGELMPLVRMCKGLEERGVFVNPVIPPATPPGRCLLRISLTAAHTEAQVALALKMLEEVGRELGVI